MKTRDAALDDTPRSEVLGVPVTHRSLAAALDEIRRRAHDGSGGVTCLASVYSVMLAEDDADFRNALAGAELVLPDGMPLAWSLRLDGFRDAERVPGMALTEATLSMAGDEGLGVGFFGGRPENLASLLAAVSESWPGVKVAYAHAPPFGEISVDDTANHIDAINASGARVLFVGLGCPRQELWMARHRASITPIMLGVGAVFDFLAGTKPRAPKVLQRTGLEWLFRWALEPRRLFRRYAYHNPRFAWRFVRYRLGR